MVQSVTVYNICVFAFFPLGSNYLSMPSDIYFSVRRDNYRGMVKYMQTQ